MIQYLPPMAAEALQLRMENPTTRNKTEDNDVVTNICYEMKSTELRSDWGYGKQSTEMLQWSKQNKQQIKTVLSSELSDAE